MSASGGGNGSPHRLVRASAGSGKTFRLTNELIGLLLAGEDPGGILATTFTRAAAGEIRERVLSRLSDAVLDGAARGELSAHTGRDVTAEACAEALERVVGSMHRLSILTIDALFARLAGSFGLELGLPPGWRMLDEDADRRAREAAVERALDGADHEQIAGLLRDLRGGKLVAGAHWAALESVQRAYAAYLECADESVWCAIEPRGALLGDAELEAAIGALEGLEAPLTQAGKPRKHWVNNIEAAVRCSTELDWDGLCGLTLIRRVLNGDEAFDRAEITEEHTRALGPLIEHARRVVTERHARRTLATLRLAERFHGAYRAEKRSVGGVTFDDPPALLLESGVTGELERLYYRLDARLRHVLLDEFQDTSMVQFRLLEPMLDELLSQDEGGRRVLCVGDSKQSLYAWRQAEPDLLPSLPGVWGALEEETLSTSWRSSPVVLEAVNALFGGVGGNPAMRRDDAMRAAAADWDGRFDRHEAAKRDLPGLVRLMVSGEPDEGLSREHGKQASVRERAAGAVEGILAEAPDASVAVLYRSRKHIAPTLAELARRGIDASEQRGNPLTDAPAVAAAASALRFIDHPGDTAALYHVARTPLGAAAGLAWSPMAERDGPEGLYAAQRRASELRAEVARSGCGGVLASWYEACAGEMDVRGAERFERLIEMADAFDAEVAGGPSELADRAESRPVEMAGGASVRVMTIHASKGLEFDAVVLPLMGGGRGGSDHGRVLLDRGGGLGPVVRATVSPSKDVRALCPELEAVKADAERRDLHEELCCLYVACTRARRGLELIVPPDTGGKAPDLAERSFAHDLFVRGALTPDREAEPDAELWAAGDVGSWSAGLGEDRASRPARESPVRLRVTQGGGRDPARLTLATPSRKKAASLVDARDLLLRGDDRSARIGSLVHAWFELIGWIEDGEPDGAALREMAEREGFEDDEIEASLPVFRDALRAPPVREALSREATRAVLGGAEDVRLHRERTFAARVGGELLRGRFDRVTVGLERGRPVAARVIDFKTDRPAGVGDGIDFDEMAAPHRSQMEAYRVAAASLWSLPVERVSAALVFTAGGVRAWPGPGSAADDGHSG